MKLIKGDTVKIISGKDRGKTGKIVSVLPTAGKVIIDGLNLFKKHSRPRKQGEKGQMVSVAASAYGIEGDARVFFVQGADAGRRPHGGRAESALLQKMQSENLTTMPKQQEQETDEKRSATSLRRS